MNCYICKKKVGLLGFTCKCGSNQFCSHHRYPDSHNCTFDFKKEHKDKLIKNNPVIVSDKIIKF